MLLACALVLDRHGPETLLYGESNINNINACIGPGSGVLPPRTFSIDNGNAVHENIFWAENPIGSSQGIDAWQETPRPPSHVETEYANYALMTVRNELVLPYRQQAYDLLERLGRAYDELFQVDFYWPSFSRMKTA
jgi:hypothetical protein